MTAWCIFASTASRPLILLHLAQELDENGQPIQVALIPQIVVEHQGDTRGQQWHSDLTCFLVDMSAPVGSAVKDYYAGGVT